MTKRAVLTIVMCIMVQVTFAHDYDHNSELFAQILLPIAILGCLICLPLSFLLAISKLDKKVNRVLYGAYVGAAVFFFGMLRLLYSFIHNHFELTCQVVAFGFYLSLGCVVLYLVKLLVARFKYGK